ncbi:leucine-rich repeat domain-containing protein [Mesorhizobium sp. M0199]|uniref:leucine-rich repeat domain-containing protein n=1 Tax=Mesorhizobium sp. M0199 TaxID=2956911 RepID=UPI00333D5C7B
MALGPVTAAFADDPKVVLLENTDGDVRLNYPVLISNGRGYRIRCAAQVDEEKVIQGLGFVLAPSDVLSPVDPAIVASKPFDNPLLCPNGPNYAIKTFAAVGTAGPVYYLQFPTDLGSTSYTDRLYVPSCTGLVSALRLDLTQALNADPTPFFAGKIHKIDGLNCVPITVAPASFADWCMKGDRTPAETAAVMALLDSTPGGTAALGNPPACASAQSFLTSVISLDLAGFGLTNLDPLSVFPNLTSLSLAGNGISDIAPLAKMTALTFLDLSNNQITKLTALTPLTALTSLDLSHNAIANVRPLSSNRALTTLNLGNNKLSDIAPLRFLQVLTNLNLADNQLTAASVAPLSALGVLKRLDLTNNKIESLEGLGQFTDSTEIILAGNPVVGTTSLGFSDVCVLHRGDATPFGFTIRAMLALTASQSCEVAGATLNSTPSIDLSNKQISDLRPIALLNNLTSLNLSSNAIVDVSPLTDLTGLSVLNLAGNSIVKAAPLTELQSLTSLDLTGNPVDVTDFHDACLARSYAAGMLSDTQRAEINALITLAGQDKCSRAATLLGSMSTVTLQNIGLKTVDYFSIFENAHRLDLRDNALTDVSHLAALPRLTNLNLAQNQLTSLASLTALRGLESLIVDNNPISSLNGVQALGRLQNLQISGTAINNIGLLISLPLLKQAQLRNLTINYGGMEEYCLVHKLDTLALGEVRPFMLALEPRLAAAAVNPADCDAVGAWARNLDSLSLNQLNLTSIEPIRFFSNLRQLYVSENRIRDAEPLRGLRRLEALSMASNQLQDIPTLQSDIIKALDFFKNNVVEVSSLQSHTSLQWLRLDNNHIRDSRPLAGLTQLTYLDLRFNQIATGEAVGEIFPLNPYLKGNPVCNLPVTMNFPPPPLVEACRREPLTTIHIDPSVLNSVTLNPVLNERAILKGGPIADQPLLGGRILGVNPP